MADGRLKCDTNALWGFFTDTRKCQEFLDDYFKDIHEKLNSLEGRLEKERKNLIQRIDVLQNELDELMKKAFDDESNVNEQIVELKEEIEKLEERKLHITMYQNEIPDQSAILDIGKRRYQVVFSECRKIVNRYLQMVEIDIAKEEFVNYEESAGNGRYHCMSYRGTTFYCSDSLFDVYAKDKNGSTNLKLMQEGKAPIGYDGNPVELHHMQQSEKKGGIMEVTGNFHRKYHKPLHINTNDIPSGISRPNFDVLRKAYWKRRAEMILKGESHG